MVVDMLEKVVCFGETVMVLHRRGLNVKQGPQWMPGIWLGKTEQEDLHVVATCDGIIKGKAIRRTSTPWRPTWLFLVKDKPYQSTGKRIPKAVRFGGTVTPKPVTDVQPQGQDEDNVDYHAKDVQEYAAQHPHGSDDEDEELPGEPDRKRGAGVEPFSPRKSVKFPEDDDPSGRVTSAASGLAETTMVDDAPVAEPQFKAPRLSPESSPSHKGLFPPSFAGNVLQAEELIGDVDDENWESSIPDFMDSDEVFQDDETGFLEEFEEGDGHPPVLSEEELEMVDQAAGFEEINRLLEIGVLREPTPEERERGTLLTTRSVYDWRYRDGWKRRCRYVAREFKGYSKNTAETFAPTSGIGSRLILLLHVYLGWHLSFLDIRDAFLLVDQRECVLVAKPSWWRPEELREQDERVWILEKGLPGQRNAAARFFTFLSEHLEELELESIPLLPSLFRHRTRQVALCSHVDDLVFCGERCDLLWLISKIKERFTISGGDVIPAADQDPQEAVRFLKKQYFFTAEGLVVAPHEKYIEELIKLFRVEGYKPKPTPDIAQWSGDDGELEPDEAHQFRSAMGTLLYLSADRWDIQHSVRHLAQWMSKPTRFAKAGVRHLVLYLSGTQTFGMLLPYKVAGGKLDSVYGRDARHEGSELVEIFTDSDWAGDQSSALTRRRHSVSSAMVFLNGRPVTRWSRSQKSIALSSCESEYLAAVGGGAEGLHIGRLWSFLVRKETKVSVITDSSSCRAFTQRQGGGRLKHVETKYLWLQQCVKLGMLEIEGVATLLNVADIGTKKLSRLRRAFLMFLIGIVF
eukprot:s3061_g7.t1